MGSLTVRGYRAARSVAVPRLLATFATAARQAATTDSAKLPTLVRQGAEIAALLADIRPDSSKFQPALFTNADWLLAAERIESFNRNEPPSFALGLGLASALLGKSGLALVEFERAAPNASPIRPRRVRALARAVVFSRLGFIELPPSRRRRSRRHRTGVVNCSPPPTPASPTSHLGKGLEAGRPRELALAVRAWPKQPARHLSYRRAPPGGRSHGTGTGDPQPRHRRHRGRPARTADRATPVRCATAAAHRPRWHSTAPSQ
ncbi:MAG: hypothetical protein IPL39_14355 [Opitutaceae bacterium]|nr:hypothetical protein [Opitutaceae bacterium]